MNFNFTMKMPLFVLAFVFGLELFAIDLSQFPLAVGASIDEKTELRASFAGVHKFEIDRSEVIPEGENGFPENSDCKIAAEILNEIGNLRNDPIKRDHTTIVVVVGLHEKVYPYVYSMDFFEGSTRIKTIVANCEIELDYAKTTFAYEYLNQDGMVTSTCYYNKNDSTYAEIDQHFLGHMYNDGSFPLDLIEDNYGVGKDPLTQGFYVDLEVLRNILSGLPDNIRAFQLIVNGIGKWINLDGEEFSSLNKINFKELKSISGNPYTKNNLARILGVDVSLLSDQEGWDNKFSRAFEKLIGIRFHTGIDVGLVHGTPIKAPFDGELFFKFVAQENFKIGKVISLTKNFYIREKVNPRARLGFQKFETREVKIEIELYHNSGAGEKFSDPIYDDNEKNIESWIKSLIGFQTDEETKETYEKIILSNSIEFNVGDVVAYSGNTGDSTGPHSHITVLIDGKQIDPYVEFFKLWEVKPMENFDRSWYTKLSEIYFAFHGE